VSKVAADGQEESRSQRFAGDASARRIPIAIVIGVLSGFVAGLFGVGGGILIVPALVLVLGVEQRLAHGTSLAAIVPIAVGGVFGYVWSGSVDWAAVMILAGGAALGAVAGTHALHRLPQRVLRAVFSFYLLATAVSLFLNVGSTAAQEQLTLLTVSGLVLIGLAAGTIAGLLGVGGGLVMVPAMILLLSMPVTLAKGTSLAVTVPTAVVGTLRNLTSRNVDLILAAVVGLTGMAASYGGARLSVTLDPRLSKVLFACLLVAVAATLLLTRNGRRATA
jgi:uncharacterized membrane protein YfcA